MTELTAEDAAIIAKLDKPGAGIPLPQRLFLQYYVRPFIAAKTDWDDDTRRFNVLNRKILDAAEKLSDAQLEKRVLVPPQRGLEDSSRYWSAAMTLEHLVIVGTGMKKIIISLSQGIVPNHKPDTARVKPSGKPKPQEILASFRDFSATAAEEIDREVKDRRNPVRLAHPWFGPFTAHQWHWVLAQHNIIHLHQLRAIIAGLK